MVLKASQLKVADFDLNVTPATITVEIVKIFDHPDPEHAGTLIEIDILVSLSKSRKLKWKSQPLTLSIEPRVHPDRQAAFTRKRISSSC